MFALFALIVGKRQLKGLNGAHGVRFVGDKDTWFALAFRFKSFNHLKHLNKMSDSRKCDDKTAAIAIATLRSNNNALIQAN